MEGKGEGEGNVKIFIHGTKARDTRVVNNLKRSRPPRHGFARRFRSAVKRSQLKFLQSHGRSSPLRHPPLLQTIRNGIKSDSIDSQEIFVKKKKKKKKITYLWKSLKLMLKFLLRFFFFFFRYEEECKYDFPCGFLIQEFR